MLNTLVPTFLIYKLKRLGSTGNKNIQGKEWMPYICVFDFLSSKKKKVFDFQLPRKWRLEKILPSSPPKKPKKGKDWCDFFRFFPIFFLFSKVSINCSIQCYSIKLFHISKSILVCSHQLELIFCFLFFWGWIFTCVCWAIDA